MNLSKQEFLNTSDSAKYIQDKRKLRNELEVEMAKFLASGGEIKQAVNQVFKVKHGTADQYTKRSCRCEVCMDWALKKGIVKTEELRVRKK